MTPEQVKAWIAVAQTLATAGIAVVGTIKGWMHQSHPTLTPEELNAAYDSIIADDAVRAAFAVQAARSEA